MDIIKSAGGIIYYIDTEGKIKFLLIKRQALSGKVERVAPKGKIQPGEDEKTAAIREIGEEIGIRKDQLIRKSLLGTTSLRSGGKERGHLDKDVTYFLFKYTGDPTALRLIQGEGYIGVYKWMGIAQILNLIYYEDLREIIRKGYFQIQGQQANQSVKQQFIDSLL
ncbi:hypothetical protein AGMMS50249_2050 [candidate division SR1 bacterium]|nr:hypothetical protein AGMMS50249_2050 [candidate division SR1 bacterium]